MFSYRSLHYTIDFIVDCSCMAGIMTVAVCALITDYACWWSSHRWLSHTRERSVYTRWIRCLFNHCVTLRRNEIVLFTPRCYAERGVAIVCRMSVRVSVSRPNVGGLLDCDHVGWSSSKIISRSDSPGCWLSAYLNNMDLLQREQPEILAGIGRGIEWVGFGVQKL